MKVSFPSSSFSFFFSLNPKKKQIKHSLNESPKFIGKEEKSWQKFEKILTSKGKEGENEKCALWHRKF
jgi:hypothetical protein